MKFIKSITSVLVLSACPVYGIDARGRAFRNKDGRTCIYASEDESWGYFCDTDVAIRYNQSDVLSNSDIADGDHPKQKLGLSYASVAAAIGTGVVIGIGGHIGWQHSFGPSEDKNKEHHCYTNNPGEYNANGATYHYCSSKQAIHGEGCGLTLPKEEGDKCIKKVIESLKQSAYEVCFQCEFTSDQPGETRDITFRVRMFRTKQNVHADPCNVYCGAYHTVYPSNN